MSNPGGGINGDERPEEMISLEPGRADAHRETLENKDKSDCMLQEWKLPKIPTKKIYKTRRFPWQKMGKVKPIINVEEATIKFGGTEDNRVDIQILTEQLVRILRRENYSYLHLGLVQIGIVPLFGKGLDVPVTCALSDARFIKFRDGLLGGMHTNLSNGPTWCKITPNYTVSLEDPYVTKLLTIRVQTKGLSDLMRGCRNVAITYRVMYRVTNFFSHVASNSTAMCTEVFEPVPGTVLKFNARQVKPTALQWPRSWVMATPSGNSSQAPVKDTPTPSGSSNQAMVVYGEDGSIRLRFQ